MKTKKVFFNLLIVIAFSAQACEVNNEIESATISLPDINGSFDNSEPISVNVNSFSIKDATPTNVGLINDYFTHKGGNNYNVSGFYTDEFAVNKLANFDLNFILP